jgi:hypothetical protein
MGSERLMARPYSAKFLIKLSNSDPERVGIQLAKACVDAHLPAACIARFFGVSRMAVHKWFRGSYIREEKCIKIQKFIKKIKDDLNSEALPAQGLKNAESYLSSIKTDIL